MHPAGSRVRAARTMQGAVMKSFTAFESAFLGALQQERSYLQGLQGKLEAQLSAWIEHIFRDYLGYSWEEILHPEGTTVGSRGSRPLFPDLQINILDNGLIFVECKRMGRLGGPKGPEELEDGVRQLRNYIRAHLDPLAIKPKTVLGTVTDGNRWIMLGLNKVNEFHTIAEWSFLTDDPRLLAQRMWLLAKSALAQPTTAVVEFLARRTLAEVLKEDTRRLTRKVNEKLPDGSVSEELIGRWLRDVLSEASEPARSAITERPQLTPPPAPPAVPVPPTPAPGESASDKDEPSPGRIKVSDLLGAGLLLPQDVLVAGGSEGRQQTAKLTVDGRIDVAGTMFNSVSAAALRARELAGRSRRSANGWVEFRVRRNGNDIGPLLDIRSQYEDKEQQREDEGASPTKETGGTPTEATESAVAIAMEQLKPLLGLLPEMAPSAAKATISLYSGKLVVAYAYPRRTGLPRLRVFVGEICPDWATPDSTYAAWCYVDDWSENLERVVALCKDAPRRRVAESAAGQAPYRRRSEKSGNPLVAGE